MRYITATALPVFILVSAASVAAAQPGADLAAGDAAAARGDPAAQSALALRYENAEGVTRDFQKANALYCQAARQGHAEAQYRLGWVYANGRGVPRDDGVAAALFSLAADRGHELASRLLRYMPRRAGVSLPSCLLSDPPVGLKLDYGGAAQTHLDGARPQQDPALRGQSGR